MKERSRNNDKYSITDIRQASANESLPFSWLWSTKQAKCSCDFELFDIFSKPHTAWKAHDRTRYSCRTFPVAVCRKPFITSLNPSSDQRHTADSLRATSSSSASLGIPCILWDPKFHHHAHNSPSLPPILNYMYSYTIRKNQLDATGIDVYSH